ncbi:helix-turn-helix domain-containing protein [Rhodovulum sulfidophilum]
MAAMNANNIGTCQANISESCQLNWRGNMPAMTEKARPYIDIAQRLKWHRETIVGLSQADYAQSIGFKRSIYSLWEAGTHRLSLDGALALRSKYGLSLDFMYEGIDDALPMTLRNAWRDRP